MMTKVLAIEEMNTVQDILWFKIAFLNHARMSLLCVALSQKRWHISFPTDKYSKRGAGRTVFFLSLSLWMRFLRLISLNIHNYVFNIDMIIISTEWLST